MATHHFAAALKQDNDQAAHYEDLAEAIREIYTTTPDNEEALRDIIAIYLAHAEDEMLDNSAIETVLKDVPSLCFNLLKREKRKINAMLKPDKLSYKQQAKRQRQLSESDDEAN